MCRPCAVVALAWKIGLVALFVALAMRGAV